MSELETYVLERKSADAAFRALSSVRDIVVEMADGLTRSPLEMAVPNNWPSQSELSHALTNAAEANMRMRRSWDRLPGDDRAHMAAPLRMPGMKVPD